MVPSLEPLTAYFNKASERGEKTRSAEANIFCLPFEYRGAIAESCRTLKDTTPLQRGIIRHLILIIDLSAAMTEKDLRPTRYLLTIRYCQEFVTEFFEQNPISQIGIIGMRDGLAVRVSDMSGNPSDHISNLQALRKEDPKGQPSLQNALDMAHATLLYVSCACLWHFSTPWNSYPPKSLELTMTKSCTFSWDARNTPPLRLTPLLRPWRYSYYHHFPRKFPYHYNGHWSERPSRYLLDPRQTHQSTFEPSEALQRCFG